MTDELRVTLRDAAPLLIIDLRGAVTSLADEAIMQAYRSAAAQGAQNILMNFSGVDYLNSGGMAIIIGVLTEVRKAAQHLLITGLTPHYQKIFSMMGLTQYAPLFASEEEARQAIETARS